MKLKAIPMQTQAVVGQASLVNGEIHDLASIRLGQEPWRWSKAVLARKDLSAGAKVAAMAILQFVNRKAGYCFASYQTIAASCAMTERGVRAAVVALHKAGVLRVVRRGARQTNRLYLALPTVTDRGGDRHGGDGVTVMAMPPNLRDEPLTGTSKSASPPSTEASLNQPFDSPDDGRGEKQPDQQDTPVTRGNSDHAAKCRISFVAAAMLGYSTGGRTPDGRFPDAAFLECLPEPVISSLVSRNRKGVLMRSEIAELILSLGIAARIGSKQAA